MDCGAGQPVVVAEDNTLYLTGYIALTHQTEFLALTVHLAGLDFTVNYANNKPMVKTIFPDSPFLFIQGSSVLLGVAGHPAVAIYYSSQSCIPFCTMTIKGISRAY